MAKFSKPKYCPREYEIIVGEETATPDVTLWLYGDVTADGNINNNDVIQINRKNANLTSIFNSGDEELQSYRLCVANVMNDAVVNNADVMQINRKNANLSSIFDRIT